MKNALNKINLNLRGKSVREKLIVFESDDWGSLRVEGSSVCNKLISLGLINENDPFSMFDSLEKNQDLEFLAGVLKNNSTSGNSPIFTLNFVMNNPDFERIKKNNYDNYYNIPLEESYKIFNNESKTLTNILSATQDGIFLPQFHANEHFNVFKWMKKLQNNDERYLKAFDYNCYSIIESNDSNRRNLMATYEYYDPDEFNLISLNIKKGLNLFNSTFGYPSISSIAPCYVWSEKIEKILSDEGVRILQGSKYQLVPVKDKLLKKKNFQFSQNRFAQYYTVRNVLFEPTLNPNIDWVDRCLQSIKIAFMLNKPAIIGSHRINYTSGNCVINRDKNLEMLDKLIKGIIKKWPEVKFISTPRLIDFIE